MQLRPVLAVALVVAAAVGVSALLFPALSGIGGPPDVTAAETPALDPGVPDPYRGAKNDPIAVVQVGTSGDGLPIRIWNESPASRTVSVELRHNSSESTLLERTETLRPNGTLRLELRSRAGYLLAVTDESTGTTGTYPVTTDQFDCNDRLATVRVDGNGSVDSRTIATTMSCG